MMKGELKGGTYLLTVYCYVRPLLQAWLLPDLNTIPTNCVGENSF